MGSIVILDENTINKIAAGEVVDRPASIVKELVENAIDAKARHIDIVIKDAGRTLIKVIDDGIGMDSITKSHIFEKFYQGDTSHSSKGLGLGLSIVSKIVEIIGKPLSFKTS